MMNRAVGVGIPQGQLREPERGKPGQILDVLPFEYLAVRYTDRTGKIIKEVWGKSGDTLYIPTGAEDFASALRPVSADYAKQVLALLRPDTPGSPASDEVVDIVSEETVEEGASG